MFTIFCLGIGTAMVTISVLVGIYYNVIMAYTLFYMGASWASQVPWSYCNADWASLNDSDKQCFVRSAANKPMVPCVDVANDLVMPIGDVLEEEYNCTQKTLQSSVEQYWE